MAAQAYQMWQRGTTSYRHIGRKLEIDRRTVKVLVEEETELRQVAYSEEIVRSIGVHKSVQEEAWGHYDTIPEGGLRLLDLEHNRWITVPGNHQYRVAYLKLVLQAQQEIDKITGASAGEKEADPVQVNVSVNSSGAPTDAAGPAHERLLAEIDGYRLALDEADRRADPRFALDTDNPDL